MVQVDSNSRLNISLSPTSKIFIEVYYVKSIFRSNILDSPAYNSGHRYSKSFPIESVKITKCHHISDLKVSYEPCCYKLVISE